MSILSDYNNLVSLLDTSDPETIAFLEGRQTFPLGPKIEGRFSQDVSDGFGVKFHNNPRVTLILAIPGFRFEAARVVSENPLRILPEGPWGDVVGSYLSLVRKALTESQDTLLPLRVALRNTRVEIEGLMEEGLLGDD